MPIICGNMEGKLNISSFVILKKSNKNDIAANVIICRDRITQRPVFIATIYGIMRALNEPTDAKSIQIFQKENDLVGDNHFPNFWISCSVCCPDSVSSTKYDKIKYADDKITSDKKDTATNNCTLVLAKNVMVPVHVTCIKGDLFILSTAMEMKLLPNIDYPIARMTVEIYEKLLNFIDELLVPVMETPGGTVYLPEVKCILFSKYGIEQGTVIKVRAKNVVDVTREVIAISMHLENTDCGGSLVCCWCPSFSSNAWLPLGIYFGRGSLPWCSPAYLYIEIVRPLTDLLDQYDFTTSNYSSMI